MKLQDYAFDIKYLEGAKLKVSDALSRLYIEEKHKITDVIPLNFLAHTADPFIHLEYLDSANVLYAHKAISINHKPRQSKILKRQKQQPVPAASLSPNQAQTGKLQQITKRKAKKTVADKKNVQIQDIIPIHLQEIQNAVTSKAINPEFKTLFDVESNKEMITAIREPDPGMLVQQKPVVSTPDKLTIYRRHIPLQLEIDNALTELRTKVLRQLVINFETADLIREYDRSVWFKDIYAYIARDKLPGNVQTQRRVLGEASKFIVVNKLLFKLDRIKDGKTWKLHPVLVIPEKFEMNLFHMYHNSLFACHQGLWKTFLTMKDKFFISNLFAKLRNYIEACHTCLRAKPKQNRNRPYFGYIPKDYIPLEHLAVDIKYMPEGFNGFKYIILATCEQTNFVFAIPSKERTARAIADALIHRIFTITGPPQFLSVDMDKALTGAVIMTLLNSMNCIMQIISPWNHGSSKAERQIQTIGNMITKQLTGKGTTWPLYASVATYAMNTFASKALQGLTPFELVFARKPRDLSSVQFKPLAEYPIELRSYVELLIKRAQVIRSVQMDWKIEQNKDKKLLSEMYANVQRFVKGDIVYALAPSATSLETGTRKFRMDFVGPLVIAEVLDDTHYKLQLINEGQDILPGIWHINHLKRGAEITPEGVARSKAMLTQFLTMNESAYKPLALMPREHPAEETT